LREYGQGERGQFFATLCVSSFWTALKQRLFALHLTQNICLIVRASLFELYIAHVLKMFLFV